MSSIAERPIKFASSVRTPEPLPAFCLHDSQQTEARRKTPVCVPNHADHCTLGEQRLAFISLKKRYGAPSAPFAHRYPAEDIDLFVEMDPPNAQLRCPAIARLFKRALRLCGNTCFLRLAELSVSHRYKLLTSARF